MNQDKRLKKIETSLTPLDAVLLWLKDMLDSGHEQYMEKMIGDPRNPRAVLLKAVGEAVRDNHSDPPLKAELLEQAVREAQKQTDILMVLVMDLHSLVSSTYQAKHAFCPLLMQNLGHLLNELRYQNKFEPLAWESWRVMLLDTLTALWLTKKLVGSISEKYYEGRALLFPAHEEALNSDISFLEDTAKDYNTLGKIIPGWTLIDLDAQLSLMTEQVEIMVPLRVAMARARTLFTFGEGNAAGNLLDSTANASLRELKRLRSLSSQQESLTS